MRDAPPIFFLRHQKENAPRPVEKKKCSAGRSAQAQTSCRRRGMVGAPLRQSGTETRCPWGNLQPGEVWDTLILPPRCRSRSREEQPAAAKREAARCDDHPDALRTIRHGSAVTEIAEDPSVPEGQPKSEQAPIRRPPSRAEGHCTGARLTPFSLPPGAAHSLFGQDQKENGGRICPAISMAESPGRQIAAPAASPEESPTLGAGREKETAGLPASRLAVCSYAKNPFRIRSSASSSVRPRVSSFKS